MKIDLPDLSRELIVWKKGRRHNAHGLCYL
jgi:hypothetical protein